MYLQSPLVLPGLFALTVGFIGLVVTFVKKTKRYSRRMAIAAAVTCVWGFLLYAYVDSATLDQARIFSFLLFIFSCLVPTIWLVAIWNPYVLVVISDWHSWQILPVLPHIFSIFFIFLPESLSSLVVQVDSFVPFINGYLLPHVAIGSIGAALFGYAILSLAGAIGGMLWRLLQLPRSYISHIAWLLTLPLLVILTTAFVAVSGFVDLSLYVVVVLGLFLHLAMIALSMATRVFSIKPIPRSIVFHGMRDAALIYGAAGEIIASNRNADALFPFGTTLAKRLSRFDELHALALQRVPIEQVMEIKTNGDVSSWWRIRIDEVSGDSPRQLGWVLLVSDVTSEYHAANDLKVSLAQLEGLVAETRDGVAFIEPSGRVILWNASLSQLTGIPARDAVDHFVVDVHPLLASMAGFDVAPDESCWHLNGMSTGYTQNLRLGQNDEHECRSSVFPIRVSQDYVIFGMLCRDMTAIREAERQREQTIDVLEGKLAEVRALSGLLPVCGWCGKLRSDTGYWEKLDLYLANHAGAQVSHGICPSCARNLELDSRRNRIRSGD